MNNQINECKVDNEFITKIMHELLEERGRVLYNIVDVEHFNDKIIHPHQRLEVVVVYLDMLINHPYATFWPYTVKHYTNKALVSASKHGYIDIIKLILEYGADEYDESMVEAANNAHLNVVQLMLDRGATNYAEAILSAASNGRDVEDVDVHARRIKIIELMIEKINFVGNSMNSAMAAASIAGHADIVKLMIENGADCHDVSMVLAATYNHVEIVKLMMTKDDIQYDKILHVATKNGSTDVVELILSERKELNNYINHIETNNTKV